MEAGRHNVTTREPNHVVDTALIVPSFHRLFEQGKAEYLSLFAPEDIGAVVVDLYPHIHDFFVAFLTKEGVAAANAIESDRGRPGTDLETIHRLSHPGRPMAVEVSVLGDGVDRQRINPYHDHDFVPFSQQEPWNETWVEVPSLWRILHLDGTTTDFFTLITSPPENVGDYATVLEAQYSPLVFETEGLPPNAATMIAPDMYRMLETADWSGLEAADPFILAYNDGYIAGIIDARYWHPTKPIEQGWKAG